MIEEASVIFSFSLAENIKVQSFCGVPPVGLYKSYTFYCPFTKNRKGKQHFYRTAKKCGVNIMYYEHSFGDFCLSVGNMAGASCVQ